VKTEPISLPRNDDRAAVPPSFPNPENPVNRGPSFIFHPSSFPPPRKARRKRHLLWEQAVRESGGMYAQYAEALARKWTTLTPMELRVCALVKAMHPSWRIAQMLGVCEKAVENYRVRARRKMKIRSKKPLTHYLTMI
jgi:DNA-binding CsgD family transcriptional regulator